MNTIDLSKILNMSFEAKKENNSRYSMRAYAKFLNIDAGLLSKYLSGKRDVPVDFIISKRELLGIGEEVYTKLKKQRENNELLKSFRLKAPDEDYTQIDQVHRNVIEDWRYYACLELIKTKGFKPCHKWVAKELNVSTRRSQKVINDLVKAKYLDIDDRGYWRDLTQGCSTHALSDEDINMANKASQKEVLELAKRAIENVSTSKREQSSMMMATNKKKIAQAKILIRDFRRKLCDFLEDTDECDTIYQLSLSLFPLTGENSKCGVDDV